MNNEKGYEELRKNLKGLEMLNSVYNLEEDIEKSLQYSEVQREVWQDAKNLLETDDAITLQDSIDNKKPGEALDYYEDNIL